MTVTVNARLNSVRTDESKGRAYLSFNNLDVGPFDLVYPLADFNGFKQGDDVELKGELKSRSMEQPIGNGRTIPVQVPALEVQSMTYPKANS